MMGMLFKIGRGEAEPSCIDHMLDVAKCLTRPEYELASERPLILANCGFEDVIFRSTFSGSLESYDKVKAICVEKVMDYCIYNTILGYFDSLVYSSSQLLHDENAGVEEADIATKPKYLGWKETMELVKEKKKMGKAKKKLAQQQSKVPNESKKKKKNKK